MNKSVSLICLLCLLICCGPKQDEVERIFEDRVEIVLNHLEPYKIKGEPTTFTLKEEFAIDFEKNIFTEAGIIDISGADTDSNGNIYLFATRSSKDFIVKFDKNGNFITSFGSMGQGSGELLSPVCFAINNQDEIIVTDQGRTNVILYSQDGNFIIEKQVDLGTFFVFPLSNGKYLMTSIEFMPEETYDYYLMSLYSSDFERIKELERFKDYKFRAVESFEGTRLGMILGITQNNIYLGNSKRGYEVWMYDLEGDLQRKIKKEYKPVIISEEFKKRFMKPYERASEEMRKKIYFPEFQPPFQFGFTDDEGRIFVMTYEKGEKPKEYIYDIYNTDGLFIGRRNLSNYGRYGNSEFPLFAKAKNGLLYCIQTNESGSKELMVYKMKWE